MAFSTTTILPFRSAGGAASSVTAQEALAAIPGPEATRALDRLHALADEGDCDALMNLGMLHLEGLYLPLNVDRAMRFFAEAAALGRGAALHLLADGYEGGGPDFSPNRKKADLLRERAHAMGIHRPGT